MSKVTIKVSDDNLYKKSAVYTFMIIVKEQDNNSSVTNDTSNSNSSSEGSSIVFDPQTNAWISKPKTPNQQIVKVNTSQSLRAKVKSVTTSGLMTVVFSSAIDIPYNYTMFDESVICIDLLLGD